MFKAKQGDKVKINLTGKFENGYVFSSSTAQDPLEFTIGKHEVLPKIENAVIDMSLGDIKQIQVLPEEGFGVRRSELIRTVLRTEISSDILPEVGMRLKAVSPNNGEVIFTVTEVTDTTLTLDANHFLAGRTLMFDIELLELM